MASSSRRQAEIAPFAGFADTRRTFFQKLAKNQNRPWFLAHKAEYEEGWSQPMQSLLHDVFVRLQPVYKKKPLKDPHVFRIYRDVRFGADKTPYKSHVGGVVSLSAGSDSKTEAPAALYFHVGADIYAGSGLYIMSGPVLKRYREAVLDRVEGPKLARMIAALERQGYTTGAYDMLKVAPRGVPADHPRIELLRYKGLTVGYPRVPISLLTQPKLVTWLTQHARRASKLVEWLSGLC